jgi:hypothetical protein
MAFTACRFEARSHGRICSSRCASEVRAISTSRPGPRQGRRTAGRSCVSANRIAISPIRSPRAIAPYTPFGRGTFRRWTWCRSSPIRCCGSSPPAQAILFVGPKGAGKSSLFAAGCAAGLVPLADDLAIPYEADGGWRMKPGMPLGRLRDDTARRFGLSGSPSLPLAPASAGKRLYRMSDRSADPLREYRIRAVHVLAPRGGEGGPVRREPLPAPAAFAALLGETHAPTPAAARAVGRLVTRVPVVGLRRSDDLDMLPATVLSVAADAGWSLP